MIQAVEFGFDLPTRRMNIFGFGCLLDFISFPVISQLQLWQVKGFFRDAKEPRGLEMRLSSPMNLDAFRYGEMRPFFLRESDLMPVPLGRTFAFKKFNKTPPSNYHEPTSFFQRCPSFDKVLEVTRDFFNTFRIRAAFYHNPLAWDLEVRCGMYCAKRFFLGGE